MSFTIYPDTVSTPQRPQYFRNNRSTTADAENVVCTLYANSTAVGTWRKSWGTSAVGYDFDIDVRSFTERSVAPYLGEKTSFFGETGSKGFIANPDAYTPYYLYTELEVRNSSGFLETVTGSGETSNTLYCVNAVTPLSSPFMRQYYEPSATGDFLFLNAGPTAQDVSTSDAYFLTYLQRGTNAANFIYYNAAGSEIRNVVVNAGNQSSAEGMRTIKCGPAQMFGTGSWSVLSGTLPSSMASVSYYTISVGQYVGSTYTRSSELRRFDKVEACSWHRRIFWFGKLGGAEQYTIKGRIEQRQRDTGQIAQFAPFWDIDTNPPVQSYSRGIAKTEVSGQVTLDVTEPCTPEVSEWLRYLRRSPEVYILDSAGNYIPVTVEPSEAIVDISRTGTAEAKLTLVLGAENSQEI